MAKRDRSRTDKTYAKWLKEGRGQGEGSQYKPWLTIQDVPSEGVVSRGRGWKTGRRHHTLSLLELWYFYLTEWSPIVLDIREQYPLLPLERTLEIASELGVHHPTVPGTDQPAVMTTDFVLTVDNGTSKETWARQIKPESKVTAEQINKFRIEERYFRENGVKNWGVVTEKDIPIAFSKNVEDLHEYFYTDDFWHLPESLIHEAAEQLFRTYSGSSASFSSVALKLDKNLGLDGGTCLRIAKHMIARKLWLTDMHQQIRYTRSIDLRRNPSMQNDLLGQMG